MKESIIADVATFLAEIEDGARATARDFRHGRVAHPIGTIGPSP